MDQNGFRREGHNLWPFKSCWHTAHVQGCHGVCFHFHSQDAYDAPVKIWNFREAISAIEKRIPMAYGTLLLVVVAIIWGVTNPLMKKGSVGIEKCSTSGGLIQGFLQEVKFLLLNWKYLTAFGLNQCGSFLYYYALGQCEMMIAGPLTNTLTFLVTYASGKYLFGEKDDSSTTKKIGLACVCCGITLCVYDKLL